MSAQAISRKSRRKTLSHAEIEDFLCDLGQEAESVVVMGIDPYSNSDGDRSQIKVLEIDSDEQRVREYCKLIKRHVGSLIDPLACELGRQLTMNTNYKVLPSRIMFPETFQYPPESIDAKKALLLSLTPMISDADKQRQIDSKQCEDFTRCKVGKSKGRNSSFEYTDIDTDLIVATDEYEIRYLTHLSILRTAADKLNSLSLIVNSPCRTFPSSSGSNSNSKRLNADSFNHNLTDNKENTHLNGNINIDYSNINNQKNIITGESLSLPDNAVAKVLNISLLVDKNKSVGIRCKNEKKSEGVNKHYNEKKPNDANVMDIMDLGSDDEIGEVNTNTSFTKRKPRASILLPLSPLELVPDSDSPSNEPTTPDSPSPPSVGTRGHVQSKHQVRRITLSPATARFMILEAMAEEAAAAVASPSKKSPCKPSLNPFASSSSSPSNNYQPFEPSASSSSQGKNASTVVSNLDLLLRNEANEDNGCISDDITGLPDLQFERDHIENKNIDKIIQSDASSFLDENGNCSATDTDIEISDKIVDENKNAVNTINDVIDPIIPKTRSNDSKEGGCVPIVPFTGGLADMVEIGEKGHNGEIDSTNNIYSSNLVNLGIKSNIVSEVDDFVEEDFNVGGCLQDTMERSDLSLPYSSSTSPPPSFPVHPIPLDVLSSSSTPCLPSEQLVSVDSTSSDMLLTNESGSGSKLIDVENMSLNQLVNVDSKQETESNSLSHILPITVIDQGVMVTKIERHQSAGDIIHVESEVSNTTNVAAMYGDDLDALLDISDSDISAASSSSSCSQSIPSSSRSSTGSLGQPNSSTSDTSPSQGSCEDSERLISPSPKELGLHSNVSCAEAQVLNEKVIKLNDTRDRASFDSFDFIFDDSDPYENSREKEGHRRGSICTDDSDAERALLTRALTLNTVPIAVVSNDNWMSTVEYQMGNGVVSPSSANPQYPTLDKYEVVIGGDESLEPESSSLHCDQEGELYQGDSSMILEDTTGIGAISMSNDSMNLVESSSSSSSNSSCSEMEVGNKRVIQAADSYEYKAKDMVESGNRRAEDSYQSCGVLMFTDSNDDKGNMLCDERRKDDNEVQGSSSQNVTEISKSSKSGESTQIKVEVLSQETYEINADYMCNSEVDSIEINADTMQVEDDCLEMERNLVRRRDGWSPDVESDPVKSPKKKSKNDGSMADSDNDDVDKEIKYVCPVNAITVIQEREETFCSVLTGKPPGVLKTLDPESSLLTTLPRNVLMTIKATEESVTEESLSSSQDVSLSSPENPTITLEDAERRAMDRLSCRYETARWKYHWEMASFHAAKLARDSKLM